MPAVAADKSKYTIDIMNNLSKLVVAGLALAASAGITAAQPDGPPPSDRDRPLPRREGPPGDPAMRGPRLVLPLFQALDTNGDGVIDANEMTNALAVLKKLDKNGDGILTLDELLPPPPEGKAAPRPDGPPPKAGAGDSSRRPPVPPIIAVLDTNNDGVIDADEIANASAALKKLVKNGDGKLTVDQLLGPLPSGPNWRAASRGPGGPDGPGDRRGPPPGDDQPRPPRPPPDE